MSDLLCICVFPLGAPTVQKEAIEVNGMYKIVHAGVWNNNNKSCVINTNLSCQWCNKKVMQ